LSFNLGLWRSRVILNLNMLFSCKTPFFRFCLVKTKLLGDLVIFNHLPLQSAFPIQDLNIHKANGIGGTTVYFLNREGGSNLQDEYSNN
jgi:hypothetical protein